MATSGTCALSDPSLFEWGGYVGIPVVYSVVNKINGKFYIGITKRGLGLRRRAHFAAAKRGDRGKFYSAIRKYGDDAFVFSVLAECVTYKAALAKEIELIAVLRPDYNSTIGGEGIIGFKQYPHIIKRIADARRGKPGYWRGKKRPDIGIKTSIRLRANHPRYWMGKVRSQETKDKISATKTGVRRTYRTEREIAVGAQNMRKAAEARKKRIICLYDDRSFDSAKSADKYYGLGYGTAGRVARGLRNSAFGLTFQFEGAGI